MAAVFAGLTATSHAQSSLGSGITGAREITPEMRRKIEVYGENWAGRMADESASTTQVEEARDKLLRPLNAPGATLQFRREMYEVIENPLKELIERRDGIERYPHRAVNAIRILQAARTKDGLTLLASHVDPAFDDRIFVRRRAIIGCETIMLDMINSGAASEGAERRAIDRVVRTIGDATISETDAMARRHGLGALAAIGNVDNVNKGDDVIEEIAANARAKLLESFKGCLETLLSADEAPTVDDISAMHAAIIDFRDMFLLMQDDRKQRSIGRELGPLLADALSVPVGHWEHLRSSRDAVAALDGLITDSEALLHTINNRLTSTGDNVTPASDALQAAWSSDRQSEFDRALNAWSGVVSTSPYQR
ncbi:MAG: hypothetical protein AAF432_03750 [Planctomycetota bacterium]